MGEHAWGYDMCMEGKRTTLEGWLSSAGAVGIEHRSSGFHDKRFTCWAISLAHDIFYVHQSSYLKILGFIVLWGSWHFFNVHVLSENSLLYWPLRKLDCVIRWAHIICFLVWFWPILPCILVLCPWTSQPTLSETAQVFSHRLALFMACFFDRFSWKVKREISEKWWLHFVPANPLPFFCLACC